jgi:hypothetical protein
VYTGERLSRTGRPWPRGLGSGNPPGARSCAGTHEGVPAQSLRSTGDRHENRLVREDRSAADRRFARGHRPASLTAHPPQLAPNPGSPTRSTWSPAAMLRAPEGSTSRCREELLVDLRNRKIWGFSTFTEDPYPVNAVHRTPPTSHPFLLAKFALADTDKEPATSVGRALSSCSHCDIGRMGGGGRSLRAALCPGVAPPQRARISSVNLHASGPPKPDRVAGGR